MNSVIKENELWINKVWEKVNRKLIKVAKANCDKIPYTTALRLLNENTEIAERYDKVTGSNFAKKFRQAFCIDVEEIKHPSEFLEDYSS